MQNKSIVVFINKYSYLGSNVMLVDLYQQANALTKSLTVISITKIRMLTFKQKR